MQIPVLIEPVANNGYRATSGPPLAVSAEAPTREAALAELEKVLRARLPKGAEVVQVDLGATTHPLAKFVGMFKDDPLIKQWKKSVAEYRRQIDKDTDRP